MRRPTLKTIATEMDLSVSAVSRIINGKGKSIGLNDYTIKNTLAFADKVGYHPHRQAQNLRLGKTNTIGVMLFMPETTNCDLAYRLFKGISEKAQNESQSLIFFDVSNPASRITAIDKCLNAGVDGIIATHLEDELYMEHIKRIIVQGAKVVMVLDPGKCLLDCPNVKVDQEYGGFIATNYLIKKGYTRIVHLAYRRSYSSGVERFKGYKRALAEADIEYNEDLVVEDREPLESSNAGKILEMKKLPEAVFCWNDKSAIQAQHIFKKAGVDIELAGFDNREFIQYMEEPFSSIDFPLQEVGALAVDTLLSGDLTARTLTVKPDIVER